MATEDPAETPGETVECSPDAFVIASAVRYLADAIWALAKTQVLDEETGDDTIPSFDMAGNPIR